jgi:hypothetical protein
MTHTRGALGPLREGVQLLRPAISVRLGWSWFGRSCDFAEQWDEKGPDWWYTSDNNNGPFFGFVPDD